jgi:hypothetical protein
VSGPRHRSNTTLSINCLLASRPPARATIRGPSSAWSIWREGEGGEREGGRGREGHLHTQSLTTSHKPFRPQTPERFPTATPISAKFSRFDAVLLSFLIVFSLSLLGARIAQRLCCFGRASRARVPASRRASRATLIVTPVTMLQLFLPVGDPGSIAFPG